jgi:hypothetical protein
MCGKWELANLNERIRDRLLQQSITAAPEHHARRICRAIASSQRSQLPQGPV